MEKRRSCATCGSGDHHVADCTTYQRGFQCLGYEPEEKNMSQTEESEFYSGLIIKVGSRCFFKQSKGHFRMDCLLFRKAVKNQNQPKHKLSLAAVQNTRNRQAENGLNNKEAASSESSTKTVKDDTGAEMGKSLEINYEKAAADVINNVKQELATKESEKRLKQEIEKQKLNETLCMTRPQPETGENSRSRSNCNTLKMVTRKPFGITKIGARVMSIVTVAATKKQET